MEKFARVAEFVTKLGSVGVTLTFGALLLFSVLPPREFNEVEAAIGALLCIAALVFDFFVWVAKAKIVADAERKTTTLVADFLRLHPGRPESPDLANMLVEILKK